MKAPILAVVAALAIVTAACDYSPTSAYGFRLPDGDEVRGRQVFIDKQCTSCHAILGLEILREGVDPEMTIMIGGTRTQVDTYGQLVTSVINPSHKIARSYRSEEFVDNSGSKMRNYNDSMTVSELIDLVAFLQAQYSEFPDY